MTASTTRISAAVVFAAVFSASAQAQYRCDPAPSPLDQRACAAAKQGPDALRRFVNSWPLQMSGVQFSNYVDASTERAWETKSKVARQPSSEASVKVASSEPR